MTIKTFFDVWYSLGINLLNPKNLSGLNEETAKSLLKISGHKTFDSFFKEYIDCLSPPKKMRIDVTDKSNDKEETTIYDLVEIAGRGGVLNYKDMMVWELLAYVKGSSKNDWLHTSTTLAMINNAHCSSKKGIKTPNDFNPTISQWELQEERMKNAKSLDEVMFNGTE